jgi:C-terminal processing protease CtpA/Prc
MPKISQAVAMLCSLVVMDAARAVSSDGQRLQTQVQQEYPSLRFVERYRHDFPLETQGQAFWAPGVASPSVGTAEELTRALVALEDQHVALAGKNAGKSETLGVMFRTASDGSMVVWRVFGANGTDGSQATVTEGDRVMAIDGQDAAAWLTHAATLTFGGHRRGRYAEAATELGLATPVVHRVAGLGTHVTLRLQDTKGRARTVDLPYKAVDATLAKAMAGAINRSDLPRQFTLDGLRVGTLRVGAFAPQYDDAFVAASDEASKRPGATETTAMLAGYCAVIHTFIGEAELAAKGTDVLVLDLRGNLGGFDREARLMADALGSRPPVAALDVFHGAKAGTVMLKKEQPDPSCGHVVAKTQRVVLVDGGTRSAGEFLASWLWASGATVVGENTVGAGGGYEFGGASADALPGSGYAVRLSGNLTVFDPTGALAAGSHPEDALVSTLAQGGFAPSRTRPYTFQSVGVRPDVAIPTTFADLQDGGQASLVKAILRGRYKPKP